MSTYPALPADGVKARWVDTQGRPAEDASLRWENEAWTVETLLREQRVQVVLRISAGWQVRQLLLFRDLPEPDLWLATDGGGRWGEVNGAHRDDLDGCTELVVLGSVVSHVASLRRLPLVVGHTAEMRVALVDAETLSVTPTTWRYHRLGDHRWEVEEAATRTRQHFDVDLHGVPLDLGEERRRVSADAR